MGINKKIIILIVLGLTLRLALVLVAHHGDLNNNISWGTLAIERGLVNFYEGRNWPYSSPNQPPLTILTFAGAGYLWQRIENISRFINRRAGLFPSPFIWFWESRGMDLLVKLPGILADLGIALLIYIFSLNQKSKIVSREKVATLLTAVWLFNPIVWYNSAVWGQTDSLVNLFFFAGVLFLIKKDLVRAVIFFVLSLLFKGSLVLFLPLVFTYALFQKYPLKKWLFAFCSSLLVISLISVWFHPRPDLFVWLFNLYQKRIFPGEIGYLTANAFNFWWLVNPGKVLDSIIYFGLPARAWGMIIVSLGLAISLFWLKRKPSSKRLFFSFCLISLIAFLFMTRIHERYLYPFFLPATVLLGSVFGMIIPYAILSVSHLLNLYHLFWAPGIPTLVNLYNFSGFPVALSIINIAVFLYLLRFLREEKI